MLVACEYSGRVREAFRKRGHDAWSCDLLDSEDGSPFHHKGDVLELLKFPWDLMIAHPPCTYLSVSGMHWTTRGLRDPQLTEDALAFAKALMEADVPRIAVENPVSVISTRIRKPDQIVQPWQFGEDASKKTCLWLKGLPPLSPTKIIDPVFACKCGGKFEYHLGKYGCPDCEGSSGPAKSIYGNQTASGQNKLGPSDDRWKERSRTFAGIAEAMALQWGSV